MNSGKVSYHIVDRSVINCIETQGREVAVGPMEGEDCAVLHFEEEGDLFLAVSKVAPYQMHMGKYAVLSLVNKIAAQGGTCTGIMVHMMFPLRTREVHIKQLMTEITQEAAAFRLSVVGGHTELTDAVTRPVVSLTGIGKAGKGAYVPTSAVRAGLDIVMTKWIGLEGTVLLANKCEQELLTRLPAHLIEDARAFEKQLSVTKEAACAMKSGVCAMHAASEGGIFGALWELADGAGVGLSIDLKKIPVRQETIEISEFFHVNPYEMLAGGSLLLVSEHGHDLADLLVREGTEATVIGKTTDGNDRTLSNGDEIRFLERSRMDEIYKVFLAEKESL